MLFIFTKAFACFSLKAKDLISTSIFALSRHLRQYGCSGISGSINGQKATAGLPHTQHLHSEAFIGFRRMSDSETGVGLLLVRLSYSVIYLLYFGLGVCSTGPSPYLARYFWKSQVLIFVMIRSPLRNFSPHGVFRTNPSAS